MVSFLIHATQWLCVLLVLIVLAELLCRYWFRRIVRPTVYLPGQRWLIRTNEGFRPHLPEQTVYFINSEGERGNEPRRSAGEHRVLIFGGSTAECRFLDQDRTLGGVLERVLREPENLSRLSAESVHVGVVAQSGADSAALCTVMRHTLPHYRNLDTICLLCGVSDVLRWLEARAPSGGPAEPLSPDALLAAHRGMRFNLRSPALLKAASRFWQTRIRPDVIKTNAGHFAIRERKARRDTREFLRLDADPTAMVDSFRRHMRDAVEMARGHAPLVLIIRQAWFERKSISPEEDALLWGGRLGSPRAGGVPTFIEHSQLFMLFRLIDSAVQEVARDAGVPSVSLFGYPEQEPGEYYDDFHYTEKGAARAAHLVARRLVESFSSGAA